MRWWKNTQEPLHKQFRKIIKECNGDLESAYIVSLTVDGRIFNRKASEELKKAVCSRDVEANNKKWESPAFIHQEWFIDSPYRSLHRVHYSENNPALLAYTQNIDKLKRGVTTPIKPGRYLMQYFGPGTPTNLTESECKMWADRVIAAGKPSKLEFIKNTDPDGWEWVYESGPSSCMRYGSGDHHIAHGLCGEYHPVRVYAHPDNDLALAYIMSPGYEADRSSFIKNAVAARTIVNLRDKSWQRIYAEDDRERRKLTDQLEKAGFEESDAVLDGQTLTLIRKDDRVICPYFDNGRSVRIYSDHLEATHGGGMDAQNSDGYLEDEERSQCEDCGESFDEDDLWYVENHGQVCERCRDEHYIEAVLNRYGDIGYVEADQTIYCETDCKYYKDDARTLEAYEISCCSDCGSYHKESYMTYTKEDYYCENCVAQDEVDEEMYPKECLTHNTLDGTIFDDNVVKTYPHGEAAHIERCYMIKLNDDTKVYVHREFMETQRNRDWFVRSGDSIFPKEHPAIGKLFVEPILTPFEPDNLYDGSECDYSEDVLLECWEELKEAA